MPMTKEQIIQLYKDSGFAYVRSLGQVLHHFTKDGENYGLIIVKKSKPGYMWSTGEFEHSVNEKYIRMFSSPKNVNVVVLEQSSGETLVANLSQLKGAKRTINNVPVYSFTRLQFKMIDDLLQASGETTTLNLDLLKGSSNTTQQ